MEPEKNAKYYRTLFPIKEVKEWITYGGKEPVENRECAFFFENEQFIRWQTIDRFSEIAASRNLQRMEIGPVYSHPIYNRQLVSPGEFHSEHKELIFDLDADDFKDIKCCCGDSEICEKCWPYMHCAIDCLTTILRKNFGFKHILPVFSGRRGIHVWVCDERARALKGNVREAIVKYLNLKNIVSQDKFIPNFYPLLNEIFPTCEKHFLKIYRAQNIFRDKKTSVKAYEILGAEIVKRINQIIDSRAEDDESAWSYVMGEKFYGKEKFCDTPEYKQLIIWYTFPRLDANVTTGMVHLLKSPFSVHPKSGLLSVPIPYEKYSILPRTWVPSIDDLMSGNPEARKVFDASIELLKKHTEECLKESK